MRQATITGIEMRDNGFEVSRDVGLVVRLPKNPEAKVPYTEREIAQLKDLRVHFVGYKRPSRGLGLLEAVDISESLGSSGEGGMVIDLRKLPPGTTHIRIWGTK